MHSSSCVRNPASMTKHTLRKNIFEIRLALFKNLTKSPHSSPTPLQNLRKKNNPELSWTHRTPRNTKPEDSSPPKPSRRYADDKLGLKQHLVPIESSRLHNISFEEKNVQSGEPVNRKRRVTEGSMAKQSQIKEISFSITKKINNKQFKKVNYQKFVPLYQSTHVSPIFLNEQKIMQLRQVLGCGAFSEVREGQNLVNKYAIKIYDKQKFFSRGKRQRICKEIDILSRLPPHRNVISLVSAYECKTQIHLVFEHVENSQNLQTYVESKSERLSERQVKKIFYRIVKGVAHLHAYGISHRDLKPANILMGRDDDNETIIKIIDFGASTNKTMSDLRCGTPNFLCPEQIAKRQYRVCAADIWALGVILFYLCENRYPFVGNIEIELYNKIRKGKYEFVSISNPQIKDIIERALDVNPNDRITVQQLVRHPWFYCQ